MLASEYHSPVAWIYGLTNIYTTAYGLSPICPHFNLYSTGTRVTKEMTAMVHDYEGNMCWRTRYKELIG